MVNKYIDIWLVQINIALWWKMKLLLLMILESSIDLCYERYIFCTVAQKQEIPYIA